MTTGVDAVRSGDSGEVGAPDDTSSGAGYAFVRSGGTWSQQASFKASNTGTTDWFGMRLALSGDSGTLVISAPNEDSASSGIDGKQDDDSAEQAGAAYVFTRTGDRWSPQAYVKASNAEGFDEFGSAVAVSRDGRTIVVGAHFEDSGTTGINGNQADNPATDAGAVYRVRPLGSTITRSIYEQADVYARRRRRRNDRGDVDGLDLRATDGSRTSS